MKEFFSYYPSQRSRELAAKASRINELVGKEYWLKLDDRGEFPWEALKLLGEEGLLGVLVPENQGGLGGGSAELSAIIESLAYTGAGLGSYLMLSNSIIASLIARVGGEDKADLVSKLIDGSSVTCLGLAEAASGSDALSIATTAEKTRGDAYRVSGVKDYVNNSEKSLFMLIVARTSTGAKKSWGLTLFAVDPSAEGVKHVPHRKIGMRYFTTNKVYLSNVMVPEENVIGEVDKGWQYLTYMLNIDRVATAAMLVGAGRLVLDLAVDYAKNRVVFGKPIGSNQAVQHKLVEAYLRLAEARLLTYRAAELLDSGAKAHVEAAAAYTEAAEASWMSVDVAIQVLSAKAYLRQVDVDRHWRDIRLYRMAPLSRELALSFIGEYGLELPKSY